MLIKFNESKSMELPSTFSTIQPDTWTTHVANQHGAGWFAR